MRTEIQDRSIVVACTSLCILVATLWWFVHPSELTLPLAFVSLIPPLSLAFVRASRYGIVDPLAVFSFCFATYNGVVLLKLNYGLDPNDVPFATDGAMFYSAGVLSALGSLGVITGWLISKEKRSETMLQESRSQCAASFLTGIAFYLLGILLYMVQYWQIGGYLQSIAMDRGQRFEMLAQAVSMPYQGFILSGLSLMFLASIGISKSRLILSSAACTLWLGLVLLQGDRRLVLQMAMTVAMVIATLRPRALRLRPLALIAVAAAYWLAMLFGQYRTLIYDVAAGVTTWRQALVEAESENSTIDKLDQTELGAPYLSVLYYSRGAEPLRWGSSYAMSIPAVLPRALYPGEKTSAISADFADALYEGGAGYVYGWGFSPIAEAFANFGMVGPFLVMVLLTIFLVWLASYRYRSISGLLVCATLAQEAVNVNRIDFRYVYFESVYCVIAALSAVMVMKAITELTDRRPDAVRAISLRRI